MTYLHSNLFPLSDHAFTFQYGSTSIRFIQWTRRVHYKFTFQYGSTSIGNEHWKGNFTPNLHSNMFLLQLVVWYGVISCMWNLHSNMVLLQSVDDRKRMLGHAFKFTFQYGSTSMVSSILYPNAPATFTFQYGSTSIVVQIMCMEQ